MKNTICEKMMWSAMTPDIGGFTKNPLRICLSGGIVWLAVYEAMDGAMSHEQFGEMVTATMQAPLIKKAFGSKNPFDTEYQKRKVEKDRVANAMSDSEFNWITETIPGRNADENINIKSYDIKCSICVLKSLQIERWVAGAGYRMKNCAFKWGI